MKTLLIGLALLLPCISTAVAREAPLPPDSVYQLQAQMIDQAGRAQAWRARSVNRLGRFGSRHEFVHIENILRVEHRAPRRNGNHAYRA